MNETPFERAVATLASFLAARGEKAKAKLSPLRDDPEFRNLLTELAREMEQMRVRYAP